MQPVKQIMLNNLNLIVLLALSKIHYVKFKTCITSATFPTLFADTDRGSTNDSAIMSIGENDLETFAAKLKHLIIKFAERRNGERVY